MEIQVIEPRVNDRDKFAVAVYAGGSMFMLETYKTRESLSVSYTVWLKYSKTHGVTKPYPIEILDDTGGCKILEDLINDSP